MTENPTDAGDKKDGGDKKPTEPFTTPRMVAIEADLAVARAELASTVDELAARLNPRTQAARAVESAKQVFRDVVDPDASPAARRRALTIVGGAAAGVVVLVVLARLMRRR